MLRTIVTVVFIAICIALVIVVMLQESKSNGLTGTVGGMADTYWGKNKDVPWKVRWSTLPGMEPLHSCSLPLP